MTRKELQTLKQCTGVGKKVWFKDKYTREPFLVGEVEAEVSTIVSDYKHLIQRIKLDSKTERDWGGITYVYRTGYYTLSAKTRRLVWGQYHQLIPAESYQILARKANRKGWLGLSLG